MNDLYDQVDAIIKEHGWLTGQEFLDITNNNMPLYHAYVNYWDTLIVPDLLDAIRRKQYELGE